MSTKTVLERLQVKGGRTLAVIDPAPAMAPLLAAAPPAPVEQADVVLLFAPDRAAFDRTLPPTAAKIRPEAILWIAYPKLSSVLAADLSRDIIHRLAPAHGLDTVAQIALDDDWSAMRLKRL